MCYAPLKFLKGIVFLGSIFAILISIVLLAMTIYVHIEKRDITSSTNIGAVTGSLIALYVSSIVFLLLGVAGLVGSIRTSKNKQNQGTWLLALYSIGIFVFFIFFLGATIFFFVAPDSIFGSNCRNGAKTTIIDDAYNSSQLAYGSFCKDCGCNVDAKSQLYTLMKQKGLNITGPYVRYTDCPNFKADTQSSQMLAALQKLLGCGGWCSMDTGFQSDPIPYYFYRFSNINDCNTFECYSKLTNCHDSFYDFMSRKGKFIAFGCLAAALICFINIIAVCCICCHPSRTAKKGTFYSPMIQTD